MYNSIVQYLAIVAGTETINTHTPSRGLRSPTEILELGLGNDGKSLDCVIGTIPLEILLLLMFRLNVFVVNYLFILMLCCMVDIVCFEPL